MTDVECEAANLVCEVDECHLASLVKSCGGVVELNSSALKVVNCALNVVCLNANVTVRALAGCVHDLDGLGSECGCACRSCTETEDTVDCV